MYKLHFPAALGQESLHECTEGVIPYMVNINSIGQNHQQAFPGGVKGKGNGGNSGFGADLAKAACEAANPDRPGEETAQAEEGVFYITVNGKTSLLDKNALISTCHAPTGESANVYRAKDYSDENPLYLVKGTDQNGNTYEKTVDVRNVNPSNCSYPELLALSAHTGHKDFMATAVLHDYVKASSYQEPADYLAAAQGRMDDLKLLKQWDNYLQYKGWITDILGFLQMKG